MTVSELVIALLMKEVDVVVAKARRRSHALHYRPAAASSQARPWAQEQ